MSGRDEGRLLELLLEAQGDEGRVARTWADEAGLAPETAAAEVAELSAFLASCRAACAADGERASPELAERVLARTTREDLSWRGDLRLVGAFLRERLRSSRALRLAAASLVVHLLALPTIAWYVLRAPAKEEPRILFLPAEPDPAVERARGTPPLEPEPGGSPGPFELAVPPAPAGGRVAAVDALEVENALRRARFLLQRGEAPSVPPEAEGAEPPHRDGDRAGGTPLEIRLLRARSAGIHDGRWDAMLDDASAAAEVEGLAAVLLAEALLDRHALGQGEAELLPRVLAGLAAEHGTAGPALRELQLAALERARAYGLVAGTEGPLAGLQRPAAAEPRADRPVDPAWLERLGRALRAEGLRGPVVDAWLAWRPGEPALR